MSLVDELTKLDALRLSGALTDAEFAQAKAALLAAPPADQPADHLAEVRQQNELAQLDREWEIERQRYMIRNKYGVAHVPSAGLGIGAAVVGGVFGLFWTVMAVAVTGSAPDVGPFGIAKVVFPLFGLGFIAAAIGYGVYMYSQAQKYEAAFAAYKDRRARLRAE